MESNQLPQQRPWPFFLVGKGYSEGKNILKIMTTRKEEKQKKKKKIIQT